NADLKATAESETRLRRRRTVLVLVLAPIRLTRFFVVPAAEDPLQPAPEGVPLLGSPVGHRFLRADLDRGLRAVLRLSVDLGELGVHPALVAVAELRRHLALAEDLGDDVRAELGGEEAGRGIDHRRGDEIGRAS